MVCVCVCTQNGMAASFLYMRVGVRMHMCIHAHTCVHTHTFKNLIKINNKYWNKIASFEGKCPINPFEYKLDEIADCRKRNAMAIQKKLSHNPCFTFIRPIDQYLNCTPQSVPIMIKNYDKSNLYFRMNELGYGVVSLYHTMIEPVRKNFPQAIEIGNCMLNLPVHQDIGIDEIGKMCEALEQLCSDNSQSVK